MEKTKERKRVVLNEKENGKKGKTQSLNLP
jgi:hypothetical protein